MGCVTSNDLAARNLKIENQQRIDRRKDDEKVKLLLLGAGESGKSTIFKQMKVIYGEQYTELERKQFLPTVHSNIIQAMKVLCEQALIYNMTSQIKAKEEFENLRRLDENDIIDAAVGNCIKSLWKDPGIQAVWERRAEFQIIESVTYYFERLDIIKQPNYLPDKDDILYSRVRTSGIVTERYIIDRTVFEMYDVGGQRNERKKWIHCFEAVTAVIFVIALSEYDQRLFEDASTNRMVEALSLFEEICNNSYFKKSSLILFLNKRDLFAEKIKTKNIRDYIQFSDFAGPNKDYDAGVEYFLAKFLEKNNLGASRQVYHHVTCATDTKNVRVVFDACKDIILRENLKNSGFMEDMYE